MEQNKEYLAFISYQRKDEIVAKRLQHALEFYKLPITVIEKEPALKDGVRPIFVDMTELGDEPFLKPAIENALEGSRFLIVICSPRSAKSKWVNKEVEFFIKQKRIRHIIPFIIEGSPNAKEDDQRCCTPLLQKLINERELLGININEMGFDAAAVKVVSRMFRVKFSSLWNRYEKEKEEEQRKLKEQNDKYYVSQSRFIAEKAKELIDNHDSILAQRLLLEILQYGNKDKPYVENVEMIFRKSLLQNSAVLRKHKGPVLFAAFSPNGRVLATSSADNSICLWDTHSWRCIIELLGHSEAVNSVSFNKNGTLLVSSSDDGTIRVWNVTTGECVKIFREIKYTPVRFYSAIFSPEDDYIVATSDHEELYISAWEITKEHYSGVLRYHDRAVKSVCFSHDGTRLISTSSDCTIVWDTSTWEHCQELPGGCLSSFGSNDKYIVITGNYDYVGVWDTIDWKELLTIKEVTNSAMFSSDGCYIVSSHPDGFVKLWNVSSGECVNSLKCHQDEANYAIFDHDGKVVASTSYDKTIHIWDLFGNSLYKRLDGHSESVKCVAYSPNGENVVSGYEDGSIKIWDFYKGKCIREITGHGDAVYSVEYSSDGEYILSASKDGTIRIWDVISGACIRIIEEEFLVSKALFLPNLKHIISLTPYTMNLWDIETGVCVMRFIEYVKLLHPIVSHNGQLVAAVDNKNTVYIWNIQTKEKYQLSIGNDTKISSIAFGSEDHSISIITTDGNIVVIEITTQKVSNETKVFTNKEDDTYRFESDETISILRKSQIGLYDISTNQYKWLISIDLSNMSTFSIHHNERYVTVGQEDGTLQIWATPPLFELINDTARRFKDNLLTTEERKQFYLE